jgi:cytochrome c-type biogenesis protein CcmH
MDMTQLYLSVAIGTAATLLAILLLLLRAEFRGRRTALALTRRWVAAGARTSGLVLALLCTIAACAFALIPAIERDDSSRAAALTSTQGTANALDESSGSDPELAALRAYADKTDTNRQSTAAMPPAADDAVLPDVDTMIAKLVARLEKQPGDAKGWKMLGWSYLSTGRPEEASRAYETALNLEPGDMEAMEALEAAKSAQTATIPMPSSGPSDPAASPAAEVEKAAEVGSRDQDSSMVRDMVDRLAARLETSPNDEKGWLRLMRARMVLGEVDAAKAALSKARETFAGDAATVARLTALAREIGIESN